MQAIETVRIRVVYALPGEQRVLMLNLPCGTTAYRALIESGVLDRYPEFASVAPILGINGRRVLPETLVKDGDRVEVYRPLRVEPGKARRLRAAKRGATR